MTEVDWKHFRKLRAVALDRFCRRVLSDVGSLAAEADTNSHERYLVVFRLMQSRDKELAGMFDDPRRSIAEQQLALIRTQELLTEDEFAQFSTETRGLVGVWTAK